MPGGFRQNIPVTSLLDASLCSTYRGQTDHGNFQKDGPLRDWKHNWELKSTTVFCFFLSVHDVHSAELPRCCQTDNLLIGDWRENVTGWDRDSPGCSLMSVCKYVAKVSVLVILLLFFVNGCTAYSYVAVADDAAFVECAPPPRLSGPVFSVDESGWTGWWRLLYKGEVGQHYHAGRVRWCLTLHLNPNCPAFGDIPILPKHPILLV